MRNKRKISVRTQRGFTLIEVLVVIGIIAILASVVLVAVNPSRQFAQARNSQRMSNIQALLNAVGQNIADNRGIFTCAAGSIPSTATVIKAGGYDLRPCLVPTYLPDIPVDPSNGHNVSDTDYDTGYEISQDATTKRLVIAAPAAELGQTITLTR